LDWYTIIERLHIIKNNSKKVKAMSANVKKELLTLLSSFATQTVGLTAKDKKELEATIALTKERIPNKIQELPKICGLITTTLNYFEVLSAKQNVVKNNQSLKQFCENTGLLPKQAHKPSQRR
jgi:hypothetical protein